MTRHYNCKNTSVSRKTAIYLSILLLGSLPCGCYPLTSNVLRVMRQQSRLRTESLSLRVPSWHHSILGVLREVPRMGLSIESESERAEALETIKALDINPVDSAIKESNKSKTSFRKKYKHKREKPVTEKEADKLKERRQAEYDQIVSGNPGSIWAFENLFPEPVWDETSIQRDLFQFSNRERVVPVDDATSREGKKAPTGKIPAKLLRTSASGGSSIMRLWREPKLSQDKGTIRRNSAALFDKVRPDIRLDDTNNSNINTTKLSPKSWIEQSGSEKLTVDFQMTKRVEGAVYGIRQTSGSDFVYDTSLMGEGAVQFRDGVRLGNALRVNADRLTYFAKKEMARNRLEEAQELYEQALKIDPRDGRSYLGLSQIAARRRDFKLARQYLRTGISNSVSFAADGTQDFAGNPYLLQALGCLEENAGHLSEAEALFLSSVRSRPSHVAAWVALAQLRTGKLRQNAAAGRICLQTAERELKKAGLPPSSHVYTAWASLEYKKAGDIRRARELFQMALDIDPKCSAAWLQLGVMEADKENWEAAAQCFDNVLKFDKRNSRVLQAYAIMESRRPDGNSRKAIDFFERALQAKPRDAIVLQAYALFVAKLGDINSAKALLRRGTEVDKRHASIWQAWGVLETRYGTADAARNVFQQGIWSCSQLSGGQSGGYKCARLWQAWGVLEAAQGDAAAARRCFSRALDADNRNVAAITAWALMEEELGNAPDARSIFERAIKQFPAGSTEKMSLWRTYELMEQRLGNIKEAQNVYQRSMREQMALEDEIFQEDRSAVNTRAEIGSVLPRSVEVESWGSDSLGGVVRGEIWMNGGSIEAKVPKSVLEKNRRKGFSDGA